MRPATSSCWRSSPGGASGARGAPSPRCPFGVQALKVVSASTTRRVCHHYVLDWQRTSTGRGGLACRWSSSTEGSCAADHVRSAVFERCALPRHPAVYANVVVMRLALFRMLCHVEGATSLASSYKALCHSHTLGEHKVLCLAASLVAPE